MDNHLFRDRKIQRVLSAILILVMLTPVVDLYVSAGDEEIVTVIREDENMRGEHEKHFVLSDGTMLAVSYPEAVHVPDETGRYIDIDNRLYFNEESQCYENINNNTFSAVISLKGGERMVSIHTKEAPVLTFSTGIVSEETEITPLPVSSMTKVNPGVENDFSGALVDETSFDLPAYETSVCFNGVFATKEGTSLRYTLSGNALKEDIVFEKRQHVSSIVTDYVLSGMTVSKDEQGALYFYNGCEDPSYIVEAPYMYDAAGVVCNEIYVTLNDSPNGVQVTYSPSAAWLEEESRQYPVVFDPLVTTTVQTSSSITMRNYYVYNGAVTYSDTQTISKIQKADTNGTIMYYEGVTPSSSAYPSINCAYYDIQSVYLRLRNSSGIAVFNSYRLGTSGLNTTGYTTSSGTYIGAVELNMSFWVDAKLSNDYYTQNAIYSYLLYTNTVGNGYEFYTNQYTTANYRPKILVNYASKEIEGKYFLSNNDQYILYDDANVRLETNFKPKDFYYCEWEFVRLSNYNYRIKPIGISGKALAASNNGSVYLADQESSNNQLWNISWAIGSGSTPDKLMITNVANSYMLCNSGTTVTLDTNLSSSIEARKWTPIKSYQGVYQFENKNGGNLEAYKGYNYEKDIIVSTPNSNIIPDKYAFRIVFDSITQAYLINPISSCNGFDRSVCSPLDSAGEILKSIRDGTHNRFDIVEYHEVLNNQSQLSFQFRLHSNPNLSITNNNSLAILNTTSNISAQKWIVQEYAFNGSGYLLYVEMDQYCHSLGFQSPFVPKERNLLVISDYGNRGDDDNIDFHHGIDLKTTKLLPGGGDIGNDYNRNLRSLCNGVVVTVHTNGNDTAHGKYLIIRAQDDNGNYLLTPDGKYIYIMYQHLESINKQVGNTVGTDDIIAVSGASGSGNVGAHLHINILYGTFSQTGYNGSRTIDPLLFLYHDSCTQHD